MYIYEIRFHKSRKFLALIVSHPECSEWWVLQNGSDFCDEFLCDHSNETSLAALEGSICFSALLKMKFGKFVTILGVKGWLRLVISVRSFHLWVKATNRNRARWLLLQRGRPLFHVKTPKGGHTPMTDPFREFIWVVVKKGTVGIDKIAI